MANDIISKTGLFAVAVGGIVGIGVGSQISELITKKQAAETETESLRRLLLELVAENHKLDTFLSEWQGGEQQKDRKIHELTTKQETAESEKKELQDALGELEEDIRKLEGDKGAEIKDLREKLTRSFKQLSDQQDEYKEGIITQHIMQKHSMEEAHKNQMLKMRDDHNHQMFQLTSRLSKQIEMLRGSNRKSKEANQNRIHDLQVKHIAEVEELKEEHRIEIQKSNAGYIHMISEMRQHHQQQVQALNTRLEQLESQIQEIGQAYETEKLAEVDSEISSIEQRYMTILESQQNTADVKEQEYIQRLSDMHSEIKSLGIQHKEELGIMENRYIDSLREQNAEHANEMLRASKASESQLLKMRGKYRQNIMEKEQGKNEQIELLKQKHEAQNNDLRNEYEEAKQSLIDKQNRTIKQMKGNVQEDLESNKKRSRVSLK